jgi:hypothetical protein
LDGPVPPSPDGKVIIACPKICMYGESTFISAVRFVKSLFR